MMEFQQTINLAIGIAASVMGWFLRELWAAVKELKADLSKMREAIPADYVPRNELERMFDKIDHKLDKLFEKLDHKVDR